MLFTKERPRIVLVSRCCIYNKNGNQLILKRSATDTHNPNLWEYPGGKIDSGQDVAEALKRETFEETGLTIIDIKPLTYTESHLIDAGKYKSHLYVSIFSTSRCTSNEVVAISFEHSDYAWVNSDNILRYNLTNETKNACVVFSYT